MGPLQKSQQFRAPDAHLMGKFVDSNAHGICSRIDGSKLVVMEEQCFDGRESVDQFLEFEVVQRRARGDGRDRLSFWATSNFLSPNKVWPSESPPEEYVRGSIQNSVQLIVRIIAQPRKSVGANRHPRMR